jgi:hypothetical protein
MRMPAVFALTLVVCVATLLSCAHDEGPNLPPDTFLTTAPPQGAEHSYRVQMAWGGTDPDGRVASYQIAWHDGMVYSGTFEDLAWMPVSVTDSTFKVTADTCPAVGQTCHHSHTFFVRAVDNDGATDATPAYVGFDATSLTPRSQITFPPRTGGQFDLTLPTCVTIGWEGSDNDGEAVMFRYARKKYEDVPVHRPPENPNDTRWSDWSTAKQVTITLLPTEPDDPWSFYIQAKDNAGAVENVFEDGRNHVVVYVDQGLDSRPFVSISCFRGSCSATGRRQLGSRSTADTTQMNVPISVDAGDTICFRASAFPGGFAKEVTHIAFLVNNPDEPGSWATYTNPNNLCYPPHTEDFIVTPYINYVYVWVKDDYCEFGSMRRAYIIIDGQ